LHEPELEELAQRSDILSIHLPSTERTRELVGEKILSAMPKRSMLVNTARYDLVDYAALREAEAQLAALSGESMVSDRLLRHIVTRLSDEGLVIELFDTPEASLFAGESSDAEPILYELARIVAEVAALARNRVAVSGHVRAHPITLRNDPVWDKSTARAETMRQLLVLAGLDAMRLHRVTGYADRRPATADPTAPRNNRLEIVLLRRNVE
jgi:chemotaxis protein MotB